jgi:hypothetical protein
VLAGADGNSPRRRQGQGGCLGCTVSLAWPPAAKPQPILPSLRRREVCAGFNIPNIATQALSGWLCLAVGCRAQAGVAPGGVGGRAADRCHDVAMAGPAVPEAGGEQDWAEGGRGRRPTGQVRQAGMGGGDKLATPPAVETTGWCFYRAVPVPCRLVAAGQSRGRGAGGIPAHARAILQGTSARPSPFFASSPATPPPEDHHNL